MSADDLFAAARADAPPLATREAVWGKVAAEVGVGAAAAGAGGTAAALGKKLTITAGTKLVALGTVSGAAGTALLAVSLASGGADALSTGPTSGRAAHRVPAIVAGGATGGVVGGARLAEAPPRPRATPSSDAPGATDKVTGEAGEVTSATDSAGAPSSLAEEARLVTEARHALVGGYPDRTLALVRATRALPERALEPEELALEARALRALRRDAEAERAEAALRRRFPDHALAR